ncbi:MAG: protein-methionine-sulfoxide reductase catalytic subunit MsrP [Gammaproteobacteria bacterium HGW-Gammaproteobacteria-6]|nr:MAG: protein-methionine-sulfoxide reductase catalytic subunit MsrP [Gammaproteobacteria bacterium HGW-Gammaproteobacteria-6]
MNDRDNDLSITPEPVYRARRLLMQAGLLLPAASEPAAVPTGEDELTRYQDVTSYNNFYEFGSGKADPARNAGSLRTEPWTITVSGEAGNTGQFSLAQLLDGLSPERRVYRLRCVEGWSMVIPWLGVPLASVLQRFQPTPKARFVAFRTLADREQMPSVRRAVLDWPYREGLRMDEAMHPLTLLATGLYDKPLPNQNGAPLRLVVPWKYGFKSIKSIVSIQFTTDMPETSWNLSQRDEYGFYSNVNPDVDHPRWSQKTERRIAGDGRSLFAQRIPTLPFNGYGDQVASLYAGMDLRQWF